MIEDADLYERDFVAWTEGQAARIRAAAGTHPNLLIDRRVARPEAHLVNTEAQNRRGGASGRKPAFH